MTDKVTCATIINWLIEQVENKYPISPQLWLDSATKLNVLLGNETEFLYRLEAICHQKRSDYMQVPDMTSSKAEILVKAMPEYTQAKIQKAKIDQILEHIKLAKKQATLLQEEFNSNGRAIN